MFRVYIIITMIIYNRKENPLRMCDVFPLLLHSKNFILYIVLAFILFYNITAGEIIKMKSKREGNAGKSSVQCLHFNIFKKKLNDDYRITRSVNHFIWLLCIQTIYTRYTCIIDNEPIVRHHYHSPQIYHQHFT